MDLGAFLAQLAVALAPYAAKGAGKAAEKLAEDAYAKAKSVVGALRDRLRGKPKSETALAQYEAAPASVENQSVLAEVLRQEVEAQPDFQRELIALAHGLVDALKAAEQGGVKYQVSANQIIGLGDNSIFNFYGTPPTPPERK